MIPHYDVVPWEYIMVSRADIGNVLTNWLTLSQLGPNGLYVDQYSESKVWA